MKAPDQLPETLQEKLKHIPNRPGVYLMKNEAGEVIYVGKAVSLRQRVRSYFQKSRDAGAKVAAMVNHVADFDYIVTASELEALILECNLIKEHEPWYNIRLKDDKSYPYIMLSNEPFPRLSVVRRPKAEDRVFGPYTDVKAVRGTLDLLRKLFPLRTCTLDLSKNRQHRPCLLYHIGRCGAPCAGLQDEADYQETVDQVVLFLQGRQSEIISMLRARMTKAAAALEFEKAARLRDQIAAIEKVIERQKIVSEAKVDQDVLGLAVAADLACMQVLMVRSGKMVGNDHFFLDVGEEDDQGRIIAAFIQQYYAEARMIPKEILLPGEVESPAVLEKWLGRIKAGLEQGARPPAVVGAAQGGADVGEVKDEGDMGAERDVGAESDVGDEGEESGATGKRRDGRRVYLLVPKRGYKRQLVEMAIENARLVLKERVERENLRRSRNQAGLVELQELLGLPAPPAVIEAYDISNFQGDEVVASMVTMVDGEPDSSGYRRFRIRGFAGQDDFAAMKEVVRRRFTRGLKEQAELAALPEEERTAALPNMRFARFPDLILIDGGKGQLNSALEALAEVGRPDIAAVGLAKRLEEVVLPGQDETLRLPGNSQALQLLMRIRDEAHRFAVTYHRQLRAKKTAASVLDEIEGIGPKRKRLLLKHFGSLRAVRAATLEELKAVPGLPAEVAERIAKQLGNKEGGSPSP
ncbi:MAG TPA: excinuclease ABC subunit UvrC [Firmicutes bacterium]|nr:excinuclease ABC subunit UvrC [Bacillota bacterium]